MTEDEWYKEVIQISPNWSDYRTKVGEYFFRAVNNPDLQISLNLNESTQVISLALEELDIAQNKLISTNKTAKVISDRIKVLHTPLGFSRSIDIAPDFEGYEKTYLSYYGIIVEIRRIAENYFNIADIRIIFK